MLDDFDDIILAYLVIGFFYAKSSNESIRLSKYFLNL